MSKLPVYKPLLYGCAPPGQAGRRRRHVLNMSVCPSVRLLQTCQHDILNKNEPAKWSTYGATAGDDQRWWSGGERLRSHWAEYRLLGLTDGAVA